MLFVHMVVVNEWMKQPEKMGKKEIKRENLSEIHFWIESNSKVARQVVIEDNMKDLSGSILFVEK